MVNVSRYLTASVQDGAILLSVRNEESYFYVIGSTVKSNAPKGANSPSMSSLVLYPEAGEEGLIALHIQISQGRDHKGRANHTSLSIFLKVSQTDGQPRIDLDREWFPTQRVGALVRGDIQVQARDRVFTSSSLYRERKPGDPYSDMDGDLLVGYLFGKVHTADLIHAAAQPLLEDSARAKLARALSHAQNLQMCVSRLEDRAIEAESNYAKVSEVGEKLYRLIRSLRGLTTGFWPLIGRERIKALIDEQSATA